MADHDEKQAGRIQWTNVDVESGARTRVPLQRSNSRNSIDSIRSHRRASIDPSTALPITYRTVSYQIAESQEKSKADVQLAKKSAAKGKNVIGL